MMSEDRNRLGRIDKEVSDTLASLDDLPEIEAGPYFYTRVRERVRETEPMASGLIVRWLFESRLGPAFLVLVVLANLATVSVTLLGGRRSTVNRNQAVEAISAMYSLSASSPTWDISR